MRKTQHKHLNFCFKVKTGHASSNTKISSNSTKASLPTIFVVKLSKFSGSSFNFFSLRIFSPSYNFCLECHLTILRQNKRKYRTPEFSPCVSWPLAKSQRSAVFFQVFEDKRLSFTEDQRNTFEIPKHCLKSWCYLTPLGLRRRFFSFDCAEVRCLHAAAC